MFLCLHLNSTEEGRNDVEGAAEFLFTPAGSDFYNARGEGDTQWVVGNRNDEKNMLLAYQLQKSYTKNLGVVDRGVKRARYQVLREATMPAVLIEGVQMRHRSEGTGENLRSGVSEADGAGDCGGCVELQAGG